MADPVVLHIRSLGAHGDGVAEHDGAQVFVPRALEGETVEAIVADDGRGELVRVIEASASRVPPLCPHFGDCGGCRTQHLSGEANRAWKHGIVTQAFRHRGLACDIEPVRGVGLHSRRRAVFAAKRQGSEVVLGFRAEGSHRIVDMSCCPVLDPKLEGLLPKLRSLLGVLLDDGESARLYVLLADNGIDVACGTLKRTLSPQQAEYVAAIAQDSALVRLRVGGAPLMQRAVPVIRLGGVPAEVSAEMFVQAVPEAEEMLISLVSESIGKAKCVADLFSGAGTFTFALAKRARVMAVDGDGASIGVLVKAAKGAGGLKPIETRVRDLFKAPLSRLELAPFDAVLLDPPRAGAKEQAEAIARSEVGRVLAVSCNPATLARDARILVDAGFTLERVVPIDQFLFSPHVEVFASFQRDRPKRAARFAQRR